MSTRELSERRAGTEIGRNRAAGDAIKERWVEAQFNTAVTTNAGLFVDLITNGLMRVDWEAIGRAFREE